MKSTHRLAAPAAGFLALTLAAAPLMAQGQQPLQRGGPPTGDTPYILITTFHSDDRKLGVEMADELRKRVSQEHSAKELFVIQKTPITNTLEASGYRPDSALSSSDLMELSKALRGELVVDGTISKAGERVKVESKILTKSGQATLTQPLPEIDAKDAGDAAKQLEKAISEANKAATSFKQCKNNMVAAKYPEAATAARAGITAYPNSSFSRVCLLQALVAQKAPSDEIIEVASQIATADPTSVIAQANLADAYMAKGDTTKSIEHQIALWRIDNTNTQLVRSIVQTLAQSGAPDKAIQMIDTLLVNNPADPEMLRTKWLLQLRANQFKAALVTGEEYIKAVPDSANVGYFERQIGAAQSDSNAAAVQELVNRAAAKFPTNSSFNLLLAQSQLKAGQLQQAIESANKATQADPKDTRGWLLMLAAYNQMKQGDSAVAVAQRAIAAGASKDDIGGQLSAVAGEAVKKAQASKARADWEDALRASQQVDQIAPSANSAFFVGVSSFSVALDALNNIQTLSKSSKKEDKAAACAEVKVVEDNFATAQISMPKGGSVSPEAAGTIMQGIQQYGEYIPQFKKALACK